MSKGFGKSSSTSLENGKDAKTNSIVSKSQIKTIQANSPCICGSNLNYKECCELSHNDYSLEVNPIQMNRARYSAYALGLPDYIIQTSHYTNKDYQRHSSSNKDPKQAFKSWKKEIITKNSEVFDFLKFEFIDHMTNINEHTSELSETVNYYVIAREKRTSKVIAFKESAIYIKDVRSKHEIALINNNNNINNNSQWYYVNGTVTPMDEKILENYLKDLPKYAVQDTIRDRW